MKKQKFSEAFGACIKDEKVLQELGQGLISSIRLYEEIKTIEIDLDLNQKVDQDIIDTAVESIAGATGLKIVTINPSVIKKQTKKSQKGAVSIRTYLCLKARKMSCTEAPSSLTQGP